MPFRDGALYRRLRAKEPTEVGLTTSQYATLLQFLDTGPYVATTARLHTLLHRLDDGYHRPPRPPIPLRDLKAALHAAK